MRKIKNSYAEWFNNNGWDSSFQSAHTSSVSLKLRTWNGTLVWGNLNFLKERGEKKGLVLMAMVLTHTMMTNARPGRDLLYKLSQMSYFVEKENWKKEFA